MSENEGGRSQWVTVVTIVAPVLSAIAVALLTQQTNVRLAEMEREAKASETAVAQSKLREQQETRRQQFMVDHMPKLFSSNATDRQLGKALLLLNFPNEAVEILAQISPAAQTEDVRLSLERTTREASRLQSETGDWGIVVSGDTTLGNAKWEVARATRLGYKPVSVYLRDGYYRTVVGNYPNRQVAEQAAIAIRPNTRSDAYVVALGRWCAGPTVGTEDSLQVFACPAKRQSEP